MGFWKGFHLSKQCPTIMHLMFADEMVLFTEASLELIEMIHSVLEEFCKVYGLKINVSKTIIVFCSKNISLYVRKSICDMCGFAEIQDMGNCTPLFVGGLGFKRVSIQNDAFLMKVSYNLVAQSHHLWVRFLHAKCRCRELLPGSLARSTGSDILDHIVVIKPPIMMSLADTPSWLWNDGRDFTVKSTYDAHLSLPSEPRDGLWEVIHKFRDLKGLKPFYGLFVRVASSPTPKEFTGTLLIRLPVLRAEPWWKILITYNEESDIVIGCSRRLQVATCRALVSHIQQQSVGGSVHLRCNDWSLPPVGCLKINVDGARRAIDGVASCGGVIRDSNGIWVAGFSKLIGCCSVLEVKFWAIFEGLCCAKSSMVIVESDNLDVIDVLSGTRRRTLYSSLLGSIKAVMEDNWCVVYRHVYRESNRVADAMTRLFSLNSFEPRIFLYPLDEVFVFLG
ncbi:hypothetical protein GQ457_17G015550 [Hibiscus cannabinus]